ncbi:MAG: hypothetical protein DCC67_12075 [Planctomycetota bacterium]|nr:MAG: hypothetical protein DCC67_12075 [Planctomycetota bacterium]
MDWIANQFDVLNVISGPQNGEDLRVPSDNYNGITIGRSVTNTGVFRQVDIENDNGFFDDAEGDRVSVDLIAPGVAIQICRPGEGNVTAVDTGTSFAAPHVTGTIALLNEYADYQVENSGGVRWDVDHTRKHEVMKAVLLNSADKLNGVHGSTRDVLMEDGESKWTDSIAFRDDAVSLDQEMGAGHLNASRALMQFQSGEYNNGESVPNIGWDYGETGGQGTTLSYPLANNFGGGFVAVTLAWDRKVEKFGGIDDTYDPSNTFTPTPFLDDLDVFICPVGWTNPYTDQVAMSVTSDDNVEHIFKAIGPGRFEIVVRQAGGVDTDFGLAWWFGNPAAPIPGDFEEDGDVDGADLGKWKTSFAVNSGSDADADGDSDGADFLTWQRNLGQISAVPAAVPVPEPASWSLASVAIALFGRRHAMFRSLACCFAAIAVLAHGTWALAAPTAIYNPETGNLRLTNDVASMALAFDSFSRQAYTSNLAGFTITQTLPSGAKFDQGDLPWAFALLNLPAGSFDIGNVVVPFTPPSDLRLFSYATLPGSPIWGSISVVEGDNGPSLDQTPTKSDPNAGPSATEPPSGQSNAPVRPVTNTAPASRPAHDPFAKAPAAAPEATVSVSFTSKRRAVSAEEIAAGVPVGVVNDFFVTSATDIIGIRDVEVHGAIYQSRYGVDYRAPSAKLLKHLPGISADSFLTTPGQPYVVGSYANSLSHADTIWYDYDTSRPQTDFLFARLTVAEAGRFAGTMAVAGPSGPVYVPFDFELSAGSLDSSPNRMRALAAAAPEPHAGLLLAIGLSAMLRRRRPRGTAPGATLSR